jgi:hypothetical protein
MKALNSDNNNILEILKLKLGNRLRDGKIDMPI